MKNTNLIILVLFLSLSSISSQENGLGLRGDSEAIADAKAMVESMGGVEIWSQLKKIHLVHRWYPWYKTDSYVENEIIDFTGSRSKAERKSEIFHQIRTYSPEGKHWRITNGKLEFSQEEVLKRAMERAPFNFYKLVKGVASNDAFYEIKYGEGDIPHTKRLEFYSTNGEMEGWIILNVNYEPIVKATKDYRYVLGPLKQFGNLKVPAWGVYNNGTTRYEMISLEGDNKAPDISIFIAPEQSGE